jgi:hypothetical protein
MEFEKLCQELTENAETIRALVNGVNQAEAQIRPAPESWSILEVVCHLADEERNDFRPRLDIMLNRPSEKFAPNDSQEWITERKYNERDLAGSLEDFLAERKKSLEWLKGLANSNWEATYTTPYRTLSAGDMFTSWVVHDILHLRQLVELRYARVVTLTAPYNVEYAGGW